MFYHDHAFGITRLQVYAGMAAPYLLHDAAEDALISAGAFPTGGGAFGAGNPKPQGQEVDGNAGPGENSKRSSGKSVIEWLAVPLVCLSDEHPQQLGVARLAFMRKLRLGPG